MTYKFITNQYRALLHTTVIRKMHKTPVIKNEKHSTLMGIYGIIGALFAMQAIRGINSTPVTPQYTICLWMWECVHSHQKQRLLSIATADSALSNIQLCEQNQAALRCHVFNLLTNICIYRSHQYHFWHVSPCILAVCRRLIVRGVQHMLGHTGMRLHISNLCCLHYLCLFFDVSILSLYIFLHSLVYSASVVSWWWRKYIHTKMINLKSWLDSSSTFLQSLCIFLFQRGRETDWWRKR